MGLRIVRNESKKKPLPTRASLRYVALLVCLVGAARVSGDVVTSGLEVAIAAISGTTISIDLRNAGSAPLRVFSEANSWGADKWRAMRVRRGVVELWYQHGLTRRFSRNVPSYEVIAPHARVSRTLNPAGTEWRSPNGTPFNVMPGDIIVVVYDVPWSFEAREQGVWCGVVAATKRL